MDQKTLDRQYAPSSCVPSLQRYLDEYSARSSAARQNHEVRTDLCYWPHTGHTLDFFPAAAPGAPLHVFVHGGNWQELTKDSSAFAAPEFLLSGAAFAAVDYGLAPVFTLDEIVAMVRRCVRWLYTQAEQFDFDPDRMYLSGTSAGAHLAAMALVPDQESEQLDIARQIAGVTLMSGMYDLEPVIPEGAGPCLARVGGFDALGVVVSLFLGVVVLCAWWCRAWWRAGLVACP